MHGHRTLVDGRFDMPRLGVAAGRVPDVADLDELSPCGAQRVVVGIAVEALDNDLVGHGVGIGQEVHLVNVKSGEAGGSADQQARGRGRP